jgi:hypothetical protein
MELRNQYVMPDGAYLYSDAIDLPDVGDLAVFFKEVK